MTYSSDEKIPPTYEIAVATVIGSDVAIDSADGDAVRKRIESALSELGDSSTKVRISFKGLRLITSAFLSSAVGTLYRDHPAEVLRDRLQILDAQQQDLSLLKRVVTHAQQYFKNPALNDQIIQSVMNQE